MINNTSNKNIINKINIINIINIINNKNNTKDIMLKIIFFMSSSFIFIAGGTSLDDFIEHIVAYQNNSTSQEYESLANLYNNLSDADKESAHKYMSDNNITINLETAQDSLDSLLRSHSFEQFVEKYYDYQEQLIAFKDLIDAYTVINSIKDKQDAQELIQGYLSTFSQEQFKEVDEIYSNHLLCEIERKKNELEILKNTHNTLVNHYNQQKSDYEELSTSHNQAQKHNKFLKDSIELYNNNLTNIYAQLNSYKNINEAQQACLLLDQQIKDKREYINTLKEKIANLHN